ncbi:MAG: proline iminopeptidase-family hydrolase [Neisseriaceae bacterium]|nr:proline iminopeptidase-family hydrolase [Neisseriaceae bacterium]
MDITALKADYSGHINVPGGRIWYRENRCQTKSGLPPVIIIHGGPGGTHNSLLPCLQLSQERTVIFYDQLGSGHSDRPEDQALWQLARFTDEVEAIRDTLGLEECHLLAGSWGGSVALNYAARKPKGLKSVVLSGPLVQTERWMADNNAHRAALPAAVQATLLKHEATADYAHPDYEAAVRVFYERHLCRQLPWPAFMSAGGGSNEALYQSMWGPTEFLCTGTLRDLDLTPLLPSIDTPTLFVAGEYDEGTPAACADFAAMMPFAEAFMVPGASHKPFIEAPEVFFNHVAAFLRGHD